MQLCTLGLAAILALSSTGSAQQEHVTLRVDGASRELALSDSTAWLEQWSAGPIDVWIASRKQGKSWTLEYELSARALVPKVDSVTIQVPGCPDKLIAVGMQWPAGRSLSGRVGEELPLLSDWPKQKLTFGPLNIKLPRINDVVAQTSWAAGKLKGLRAALAARSSDGFPIDDTLDGLWAARPDAPAWIGPWVCWTAPDPGPGAPGGSGINHTTGWQDNEPYAQLACEIEALAMGRMWCLHNADGSWYSVDQFRKPGQVSPNCTSEANIKPLAFGGEKDPNDPLWKPISISHYPRVLRYCQAAYEMTGSRLARRHLIQLAESARLQFTEWGQLSAGGGWIAWNLSTWEYLAKQKNPPHSGLIAPEFGLGWDRNHGWMLWAAAEAKKAGMTWTPGWADWAQRMVGALTTSQMENGLFCRAYIAAYPDEDVCAAMHEALLGMGLLAIHVQAGIPIPTVLPDHAHTLYQEAPIGPYHGQRGPLHFLVVAPRKGEPFATITKGYGEPSIQPPTDTGDPIIAESYLAAVYALTGDKSFAEIALDLGTPATGRGNKLNQMRDPKTPLMQRYWQAYLLAQLQ